MSADPVVIAGYVQPAGATSLSLRLSDGRTVAVPFGAQHFYVVDLTGADAADVRAHGVALVAVLTLACAIGANTVVFSAINALLLKTERVGIGHAEALVDKATILLMSDHGEGLGDHGEDEHGVLLYRETLQVPLMLKLPKSARKGTSVSAPVQLIEDRGQREHVSARGRGVSQHSGHQ